MGAGKIGYTSQLPRTRFQQITSPTGNPWGIKLDVEVDGLILCDSVEIAISLESLMHADCAPYKIAGNEWFRVIPEAIQDVFSEADPRRPIGWAKAMQIANRLIQGKHATISTYGIYHANTVRNIVSSARA